MGLSQAVGQAVLFMLARLMDVVSLQPSWDLRCLGCLQQAWHAMRLSL
jgi:hypothetical protein